ncbi:SET domain-containing protein, partial [Massarina eburnea CBS 473.64]
PTRHTYSLRNQSKYFWYTGLDNNLHLATAASKSRPDLIQMNHYTIDAASLQNEQYPCTFPAHPKLTWPPKQPIDIVRAIGTDYADCVADACFSRKRCKDLNCTHSFSTFQNASQDWEKHFELRETRDRGIGVIARTSLPKGTVLGFYAGKLLSSKFSGTNDYLMELGIGDLASYGLLDDEDEERGLKDEMVFIDGFKQGNWTRFMNHSCNAHAEFVMMRAGETRIMAAVLRKPIEEGEELTVSYGESYWLHRMDGMRCRCGMPRCVA